MLLILIFGENCWSQGYVDSTSGRLDFDVNDDGDPEMELTSHGLGVGLSASANFSIGGNGIITGALPYVQMHSSSSSDQLLMIGNKEMNAGSNNGDRYKFDGYIDSLRIYNIALSPDQVNELYKLRQ